ncbi:hypothetical protein [Staphylococcus equorum]|uniref:hypothetical protein n=1 Tax=Staphylococcus equorum TaxID=246432 RepID=UPI001865E0F5|nr:hypothetical protein [Staphylococcus equorum]
MKEFNDYFENNKGEIIEERNFEEGYNSRTGSTESFETLLNEYKLDTENIIKEDSFNKLTENAQGELNKQNRLNVEGFESSLLLQDYPNIENALKNIDEDIQKLGQIEKGDLRNIKVSINDFKTSYDVSNINSLNKETIISRDLVNDKQNIKKPTWEYENESQTNNLNQNYKDFENITSKDTTQEIINESILYKELEMNRKYPNNPYGTIEDFINKKSVDENLSDAYKKMDNLNLNYHDSVEFYNNVNNEIQIESNKLEQTDRYKNANGEQQSYQKSAVIDKVEKNNGIKENSDYNLKDILNLYAIKNSSSYLSEKIDNYQPNNNIHDKNLKKDTSTDLQKLKSVEVEKNVIGLLPKDQQENTFKETLSRLDNNKTSLKDNLKKYMSNEKIDNAINSVKHHFENIKVKAEDVQQTFKDLGQWNTENKFVKDIDNVINSVKDLGKKHENELLQSDSNSIMSKLNNEYLELKEFVNKAEQDNNTFKEEQNIRSEFVSKMLNAKQIEIDFDPKEVTKDLSENQKLEVYNQLKDLNHHYQNNANTTSLVKEQENKVIIKNLEEDNPEFKNNRQEHVTLKQSLQPIKIETTNEKLDNIIKDSNKDIKKMDGLDKKNFKESKNKEKTITNQNSQSSKIKSNDMFKKMEKLNQQTINENTEKKEPKISRQSMTR